ncbi:MAG TPA: YihY family inner membrane protein [Ottowia sp.]|uniref:YihY family inner membrane protein n=1 Tax=Ottowia sp. TaxID=1898956 RepID=UPI002BF38C9C|nr:YihY family inner membrane protein [Ottowia sp.]HMN21568.1 YihY family inner membrane protein [Ottowia sp.]
MNPTVPGGRLRRAVADLAEFPLGATALTLWQRFQQDRLSLTASSLTYTTVLALVPFFAVVLSVFTAFPAFGQLQAALQQWLVESLIPGSIAGHVMGYLTQFASKASQLGLIGMAGLTVTAVSLMLTIDKTLNQIWRTSRQRPLGQRVLVYWAALTLGPLVMGASLAITSYVVTVSRGWLPDLPGGVDFALAALQFLLLTGGVTLLYRYVPNTPVRWAHALAGAVFVTICLGLARGALGLYLARIPTYSAIYGAFATLPILLLWIYLSWLIVLLGAVIAAYLPSLLAGAMRRPDGPGWEFRLAIELLAALARARSAPARGLTRPELAHALQVDVLQLAPLLDALDALDWVGELGTRRENEEPRLVLLAEPAAVPLAPLVDRLLLAPAAEAVPAWRDKPLAALTLSDALAHPTATA